MDPKDKEIADLKDAMAKLTTQVTTVTGERDAATKERDTFKADNEKLGKDLSAKDQTIESQKTQIIGARKKYSEMKPDELKDLTDAEKLSLQEIEDNKNRLDKFEADRKADIEKQRASLLETEIGRYTNKPDIQAAIKKNLERLADFGKATTSQEIADAVKTGINMLGTLTPGSINQVVTAPQGGAPFDSAKKVDYADTPEGQAMLAKIAPQAVTPIAK